MTKSNLNINKDFIVRESVAVNLAAGLFLVLVFMISMAVADFGWGHFLQGAVLLLLPGAFYLARAKRKAIIMRINKTGLYYSGRLFTSWTNFLGARVTQEEIVGSIQDNFILIVRHYNEHSTECSVKIPLNNTQDKAEEEIIEAINFYYSSTLPAGKQ